jgi:hypothetical protein
MALVLARSPRLHRATKPFLLVARLHSGGMASPCARAHILYYYPRTCELTATHRATQGR